MSDPRTVWTFTVGATAIAMYDQVGDDYEQYFNGSLQTTKDTVLGATTAAQSYVDVGAFVVPPVSRRYEFLTSANRNVFYALQGSTGTLASSTGLSYTVLLTACKRIEGAIYPRADVTWEQR